MVRKNMQKIQNISIFSVNLAVTTEESYPKSKSGLYLTHSKMDKNFGKRPARKLVRVKGEILGKVTFRGVDRNLDRVRIIGRGRGGKRRWQPFRGGRLEDIGWEGEGGGLGVMGGGWKLDGYPLLHLSSSCKDKG